MKKKGRAFLGIALSAEMAVSAAMPLHASAAAETEASSEGLVAAAAEGGEVLSEKIAKGHESSLEIQAEEPLQEAISSAAKGMDMSWLKTVTLSGASAGNEDGGIDASGVFSANGEELYHGLISIDADDRKIYLVCPEFRKTPAVVDLDRLIGDAREEAGLPDEKTEEKKGSSEKDFKADYTRLLGEGKDFISSVSMDEWTAFPERYRDAFLDNAEFTDHENVAVTAGALSEDIDTRTATVSQDGAAALLSSSMETLESDPLILKVLKSDFASDLVNTILSETGSDMTVDADFLTEGYGKLLNTLEKEDFSNVPGFTVTYGMDSEGRLAEVDLGVLYSGASVGVFSLKMLRRETHRAVEFNLGALITSFLAGKTGGDPNGATGFLLEADSQGDLANDSLTVTVAGQELGSVTCTDIDLAQLRQGALIGTASLQIGDLAFEAVFEHPEEGTEIITGKYNDTVYLTATARADESDHVKVDEIRRKKAMEVYDQSTWDEYIKDASLTKMIRRLSKAGVPDSIVEALTSGEAATESSRENTVEKDGTDQPENGEVGGADIGK